MSVFSSILNSLYTYLYGHGYKVGQPGIPCELQIPSSACGLLRRMYSTQERSSNRIVDSSGIHFVYPIDTCQTAYLVEKTNSNNYRATILFTRETDDALIDAKLDVIMIRILTAEKNIPVLELTKRWAIVGTIDCQPDRNKSATGFHQDSILVEFIPNNVNGINLKQTFNDFFRNIFSPRNEYFDPMVNGVSLDNQENADSHATLGFRVETFLTAHFGILDYNSPIPIIAAASRNGDFYTFTILPAATDEFRAFLFYLNSIITHATPEPINEVAILIYYQQNPLPDPFTSIGQLVASIRRYNEFLSEASKYRRDFRRLLGKCIVPLKNPVLKKKDTEKINELKAIFKKNATHIYLDENPPNPPITESKAPPPDAPIDKKNYEGYDDESESTKKLKKSNSDSDSNFNPNIYTFASKIYRSDTISILKEDINTIQGRENDTIIPKQFNVDRLAVDGAPAPALVEEEEEEEHDDDDDGNESDVEEVDLNKDSKKRKTGGKSKRNKSKRRNTRKKYYFKKRRSSQRKQNKKRRSRKR